MPAKKSSKVAAANKLTPMEEMLGPNVLVDATTEKPTKEVLKDKDMVLVYFSAAWCPPCKGFTPILSDFYNNHAKEGKFEIVYISSDKDKEEFTEYFGKMPWVAQPVDAKSAEKKNSLAATLKISRVPVLVVLDAKTGNFISDMARTDVAMAGKDSEKQAAVLAKWKATKPVPIEEAELTGGGGPMTFGTIMYSLLKNPMFIFALMFGVKKLLKLFSEYQRKKALEAGHDGDAAEL